jgi:hypothetical protein
MTRRTNAAYWSFSTIRPRRFGVNKALLWDRAPPVTNSARSARPPALLHQRFRVALIHVQARPDAPSCDRLAASSTA